MNKTIMQENKECFLCGTTNDLHLHHIIFGKNRKKCDEDKLTIYLCREHHEGTNGVHGKNGHKLDMWLKQRAERKWCEYYKRTISEFIDRYGKNYL